MLAAPLDVASGIQVVIELFDKEGGFTEDDQQLAGFVAEFGVELLRRGLAETHTQRLLFDAVSAALGATQNVAQTMATSSVNEAEQPAPLEVLDKLRSGLEHAGAGHSSADAIIRLAEAIRVLAARHGEPAIRHCIRLVEQLKALLDEVTDS
ncbi:MAG: hypothetical protein KatS3mg105_1563 [Gemmatales bacterium]|nr:MAG: hypothetical protein KatS3mg105_1563 [Gemmatales bacterium]